jgi:vitamin B12 transporter
MKQQFSIKQCTPALLATLLSSVIPFQSTAAQTPSVSVSNTADPLNPILVTATRTPTKASDVLADNVYIGPEEIAQAGQTSLVELLQRHDHIEIVFGPQSSLYGSDAIGGVIQIFTKKGAGSAQVNASTGYGSYGTSITDVSIYGSLGTEKITSYSLSASQEISTGFSSIASNNLCNPNTQSTATLNRNFCNTTRLSMGRTGYTKSGASGRLSQEWEKGQEVGFQFLSSRLENQYPVDPYFGGGIGDQVNNLGIFSAFSNNQINQYWKSSLQVSQSNDLGQQIYSNNAPLINTKLTTYSWQNDLKVGPDLLQLVAERKTANAFATDGNINQEQNTNTLAGSYKLQRGSHLANLAIRNDSITGFSPQTTGSASYGYFFTKNFRGNINYGTGFKAPSFFDLYYPNYGNTNLLPEKSKNTEIGLHKNLSLFGRWNNVFNKDYQLSYGFNTPGSNVFFGLRYAMQ